MTFNRRCFNFSLFILVSIFVSSSTAAFCSNLTSSDDKDTPCFLEQATHNPGYLRSAGNNLVLPCHVARSKRSTIEWWYRDFDNKVSIKIYPVFPAVRPTVLRFLTSGTALIKNSTETDIMDVSVLLRHVNVDDSGIFTCVIRPWTTNPMQSTDEDLQDDYSKLPSLSYYVELSGPRLCHSSLGALPCFANMRTSSPSSIDAYQTAFLQCVVHNHNRQANVLWVVGNASANSVLITEHLAMNNNNGDRLRRVFPQSLFDYSVEITVNPDVHERSYSCVITGVGEIETTLFTYVVRSTNLEKVPEKERKVGRNETKTTNQSEHAKVPTKVEKLIPHDSLTPEQVDELRQKQTHEHSPKKAEKSNHEDDDELEDELEDDLELSRREEITTPTKIKN